MPDIETDWWGALEDLTERCKLHFVLPERVVDDLSSIVARPDSPVVGVSLDVSADSPHPNTSISVGDVQGDQTGSLMKKHPSLNVHFSVSFRAAPTQTSNATITDVELQARLMTLLEALWMPITRDKFALLAVTQPGDVHWVERTMARWMGMGRLAIIFIDLDRFKAVNDTYGMTKVDQVIEQFAALASASVADVGLWLHRQAGGDEYVLLIPDASAELCLVTLDAIRHAVSKTDFDIGATAISFAAGIHLASQVHGLITQQGLWEDSVVRAETVVKPLTGEKQRGRVRFADSGQIAAPTASHPEPRILALIGAALIRTHLQSGTPFNHPWLNLISRATFGHMRSQAEALATLPESVSALLDWIQPDFQPNTSTAASPRPDLTPSFSAVDVALAVAHGLTRALSDSLSAWSLAIRTDHGETKLILDRAEGDPIQVVRLADETGNEELAIPLGGPVAGLEVDNEVDGQITTSRAALLRIGQIDIDLLQPLFVDVITVDDRPTQGGNLPDFWEAAIARVVALFCRHSTVNRLYVLGERKYAKWTVDWLERAQEWTADDTLEILHKKTGLRMADIRRVKDRIASALRIVADEIELVRDLARTSADTWTHTAPGPDHPIEQPLLMRSIDAGTFALGREAGCRVRTAAAAFPFVLAMLRDDSITTIVDDQSGQRLREVTDYRVIVTEPDEGLVPQFYATEEASLKEYYEDTFIHTEGLFRRELDAHDQLPAVIAHLVAATDPDSRFSTRRAILTVPCNYSDGVVAPLGLVCIRVIPRFPSDDSAHLHFSFVWRTVEAVVGFPYSLYGSLRFSAALCQMVRDATAEDDRRTVVLGQVSYLAQSLHLFRDAYGDGVARRIVAAASN